MLAFGMAKGLQVASRWHWTVFVSTSTLQLRPLLEQLLEPVPAAERELCQLGLQEALVNAVRHGNANDPGKCLRIRRILMRDWFVWQVQDEGIGVPLDRRRAELPEDLEAPSGRGFFLIHQCFDDVRWSPKGSRVQLAKRRQGAR